MPLIVATHAPVESSCSVCVVVGSVITIDVAVNVDVDVFVTVTTPPVEDVIVLTYESIDALFGCPVVDGPNNVQVLPTAFLVKYWAAVPDMGVELPPPPPPQAATAILKRITRKQLAIFNFISLS